MHLVGVDQPAFGDDVEVESVEARRQAALPLADRHFAAARPHVHAALDHRDPIRRRRTNGSWPLVGERLEHLRRRRLERALDRERAAHGGGSARDLALELVERRAPAFG